jgi:hypothetical protein
METTLQTHLKLRLKLPINQIQVQLRLSSETSSLTMLGASWLLVARQCQSINCKGQWTREVRMK